MGRFKIYDPKKLLRFENDSNYGKCLLCERKLKNIMGNIKRHYEQMHSVFVDASTRKPKKSRSRACKSKKLKKEIERNITITHVEPSVGGPVHETDNTKPYNIPSTSKFPICINQSNNVQNTSIKNSAKESKSKKLKKESITNITITHVKPFEGSLVHKTDNIKAYNTPSTSKFPICNNQSNNLQNTSIKNSANEPEVKIQQTDQITKISAITREAPVVHSLQLEPQKSNSPIIEGYNNKSHDIAEIKCIPMDQTDNQMSTTYHSNAKKARLLEDNDRIEVPCYSFINNIRISSVESCHQLEFLKCLVETKAHVNIPLKTFQNEDTFQKALKNWKPNFQFNYSPQTIGEHIDRMTKKLHQEIKKLVANKLIYLKLDIVSSTERNVMLVNIQFIKDFHLQVITLNALELSDDDLAAYLKKKVMSTLERFRIEISNVFSIIKDNTNNIRNYDAKNSAQISDYPSSAEYCQHLSHGFPGHAIHFAASDIITQLNENISQSRDSARNIQRQMIHLKTKSKISLDNISNWFSVYDMIESLMNVYDEVENNGLLLIEVDWAFAKKFVESFKPVVDTALMLQTNEIVIMGDFYREWLLCEMKLEELSVGNELALYLLRALRKRKLEFFENSAFLAALYVDPRFCYIGSMHLNDKQKEMAIIQLLQIFNKLKVMHKNTTSPYSTNNLKINLNDRYEKLERQIINNVKINVETTINYHEVSLRDIDEQRVKECLEQLQCEERLVFRTNILEYWNVAKYKNPILAKLAEIALAAPATQYTLSRALNASSMTLLKGKLNEKKENIENLLLLKLNQDLVDNISLEN